MTTMEDLLVCLPCGIDEPPALPPFESAMRLAGAWQAEVELVIATSHLRLGSIGGAPVTSLVHRENHRLVELARAAQATAAAMSLAASRPLRSAVLEGAYAELVATVVEHARLADLVVMPMVAQRIAIARGLLEAVLFESGRPVLAVPPAFVARPIATAVVAWDRSRAAARALHDAWPLLRLATRVVIVHIVEKPGTSIDATPVLAHLARHDVDATWMELEDETDAPAALLRACVQLDADLMVTGGYGHTRFRETILGGMTRAVLDRAPIPVLVSH